jgi:16S rRNA (guanine527-N7)-methyltransferase
VAQARDLSWRRGTEHALASQAGMNGLQDALSSPTASPRSASPCPQRPERLLAFGELLLKWNKVYNLTAIRAAGADHPPPARFARGAAAAGGMKRLADIGSGGGLPGVVLAIVRPGLQVSSIETVARRRASSSRPRSSSAGQFHALNKRVEQVQPDALPGGAPDGVISRAFSSLADFVALSGHLVAEGGALYAMKGVDPVDEVAALPAGWAGRDPCADGARAGRRASSAPHRVNGTA